MSDKEAVAAAPAGYAEYRKPILQPHRTKAPDALYFLTFAGPLPAPWRAPQQFITHPYVLYTVGVLCTLYTSAGIASLDLMYGYWSENTNNSNPPDNVKGYGARLGWILAVIGATMFVLNWIASLCFNYGSYKLALGLRYAYTAAVLAQDPTFFEKRGPGEVATFVNKDVSVIRTSLGDKLGFLINALGTLITCIIMAFSRAPVVSGVGLSTVVFAVLVFSIIGFLSESLTARAVDIDARMATFMEHVLGSVRVVHSYNIAPQLVKRLRDLYMRPFTKYAFMRSLVKGIEMGVLFFVIGAMYALVFWYGSLRVGEGKEEVKNVISAFYNYLNGMFSLAMIMPQLQSVFESVASLKKMRAHIERTPRVDIRDTSGEILGAPSLSGAGEPGTYVPSLALDHVTFAYPARPNVASLNDVSIDFAPGKVTALVGPSGSGKSTIAALLLREYDPETSNLPEGGESADDPEEHLRVCGSGRILFGGRDIRELNLRWYRSQVAVVRQHPQLFSGTIFENVAMGLARTHPLSEDNRGEKSYGPEEKVYESVVTALKKAEAWEFVSSLPEGMDTMLSGGANVHLSGGQRQRIAIARALVAEPQILCLDEATSALDSATEERIKQTLDAEQRTRGMTTVVIAHRLSTIQNADCIVAMRQGQVVESGTHEMLMAREKGLYRSMVMHNMRASGMLDGPEENVHIGAQLLPTFTTDSFVHPKENVNTYEHNAFKPSSAVAAEFYGRSGTAGNHIAGVDVGNEMVQFPESGNVRNRWPLQGLIKILRGQLGLFTVGFIFSLALSAAFPINGWISGGVLSAINIRDDVDYMRERTRFWSLWFFVLGLCMLASAFGSSFFLEFASERMVQNIRLRSITAMLNQEVAFFDDHKHSSGVLGSVIFTHASNIAMATGVVATQLIMATGNFIGSFIMSFIFDWLMTIAALPILVAMLVGGFCNVIALETLERRQQEPVDRTSAYVAELVDSIGTIISLGYQDRALSRLMKEARPKKPFFWSLMLGTQGYAFAQLCLLGFSSLIMFWGAKLLAERRIDEFTMFSVFEGLFVAIFSTMRLSTFVPDVSRASYSVIEVNSWWNRRPNYGLTIYPLHDENYINNAKERDIVMTDVELRYPERPEIAVLKNISLRIPEKCTVAFCGTSGSGKSSVLSLLQRFYEPSKGNIEYAGVDVRSIPMETWRNEMAFVSQDAVLYEGSIRWNLCLGARDPASVTDADIEDACRSACVWDFAMSLPDGLDTDVGLKGANLSGGQRQRICIARALIRKPRILLLDEATSALDAESEVLVQQALDNAAGMCTTISIAHRLSTIRRADLICVVENGQIVERGPHEELIKKRGRYFDLVEAQL